MPELRIRNVEPWIVEVYRDKARKHGLTMEREIRDTLARLAVQEMTDFLTELRQARTHQREKYGVLADSTPAMLADREAL